jgi:molecular chaperone DnaK
MYAEEDMRKKRLAETRNQADNLIYQARKILTEYKDKITEELRVNIENKIKELENAKNSEDINLIEEKIKELSITLSQIGYQFYGKQEGQQI